MAHRAVQADEGWTFGLSALGDPFADRLVILFPPAPGAGGFDPDPLLTGRWGAHVITLDRPGYGASPPLPEGTTPSLGAIVDAMAGYLRRVARIADEITQATFGPVGAIGWGEGAAYATVLAARHPDLVDRLVLVDPPRPSAVGPYADRPFSLDGLRITADDPNLALPGVRDRLEGMLHDAGLQGTAGVLTDGAAIRGADWGADVAAVRAETLLVRGKEDPLVRAADLRWFARQLPGSRLLEVPCTGMLAIVECWEEILEHVAPRHGRIKEESRDTGTLQIERDPHARSAGGTTPSSDRARELTESEGVER